MGTDKNTDQVSSLSHAKWHVAASGVKTGESMFVTKKGFRLLIDCQIIQEEFTLARILLCEIYEAQIIGKHLFGRNSLLFEDFVI